MSKLEELIKELCPNGVEYKSLKEVTEFRAGQSFPVNEQGGVGGKYPFYKVADMNNSITYMKAAQNYISEETAQKLKCKPAPKGTVIFPKVGATMGTNKKRILICDSCYDNNIMGVIAKKVDASYLYYVFGGITLLDFANGTGAVPSLNKTKLEKYRIPVPPIPVQEEIVRILDSFTELTAELTANLTAEITARKKQYEYYRDKLLTPQHSELLRISDIATTNIGLATSVTKFKSTSGVLLLHNSDIQQNAIVLKSVEYITEEFARRNASKILQKDDIITVHTGDVGTSAVIDEKYAGAIGFTTITTRIKDKSKITPQYLCHYLNSNLCKSSIASMTISDRSNLNQSSFEKLVVPVPPLETQNKIVQILDNFDSICSDLKIGIPAEIEARKKQYEFYRDKLLSF